MQPSKCQGAQLGRSVAVPDCPDLPASVPPGKPMASGGRRRQAGEPSALVDPGSVPWFMAAGVDTRRGTGGKERHARWPRSLSHEKTKLIREPLRTSSVSVAAVVTQCCIQRIVLARPWRLGHRRPPGRVTEARPGQALPDGGRRTASTHHPCRTYGLVRPAQRLDSMALGHPSLIRMRSQVQVLAGPLPAETLPAMAFGLGWAPYTG